MCRFVICNNEILDNLKEIKNAINKQTLVCAVVKADAYGFGVAKMVKLLNSGVDYFAVARFCEFLKVKELTVKPCLILSPITGKELISAIRLKAEITIASDSSVDEIEHICKKYNTDAFVHIKVDTGMNRYGIKETDELIRVLEKIKQSKYIKLVGCYSHLFFAEKTKLAKMQNNEFNKFKNIILSYGFRPIFHLSNSEGIKDLSNAYDMVRIGLSLYFKRDCSEHKLVCSVVQIKKIKKGETVGYNASYKAKQDMIIAVCGAGYGDGIKRSLSNLAEVIIGGEKCKIVGNICMDSFMADISHLKEVKIGDEVVIFGKVKEKSISVCDLAKICDTIPYEIYTSISQRVKRVYRWRRYEYYNRKIQRKGSLLS